MAGEITSKIGRVSTLPVPLTEGGTGASTVDGARTTLGINEDMGWFSNLSLVRTTTTNAGDTIKLTSADGTALSSSNAGLAKLASTTAGQVTEFTITSDISVLLTGAHWDCGTRGDLTAAILRVLLINDNGTLKLGVAKLGGRTTLLTTDTSSTQTSVTTPEGVLCNSAVGSASNSCREIGYFYCNFDDTGGAAEDLWAISSAVNGVVLGQTADGIWQPYNTSYTGFSSNPTGASHRWTQSGRVVLIVSNGSYNGTSNATSFTMTGPAKNKKAYPQQALTFRMDNGVSLYTYGIAYFNNVDTTEIILMPGPDPLTNWTAAGTKDCSFNCMYEVGPSASFI